MNCPAKSPDEPQSCVPAPGGILTGPFPLEIDHKSEELKSADRRTDSRLLVNAPVEIANLNCEDCPAVEHVFIEDVGDSGCRFSMRGPVREGDRIAIQLLDQDGKKLLEIPVKFFEVIWVQAGTESAAVGVQRIEGEKLDACKVAMERRVSRHFSE